MWLWGVQGQENFTYQLYYYHRNPYNPLDDIVPMYGHTFPGVDGPIPTMTWEAIREGIDDLRYIKTLEQYIASAKKSGNPQALKTAVEAELFLKKLKTKVGLIDWNNCNRELKLFKSQLLPGIAFYDSQRRKIADFIIALHQLRHKN